MYIYIISRNQYYGRGLLFFLNAVVSVAKVTQAGADVLFLIKAVINGTSDDLDLRELFSEQLDTLGGGKQVEEQNALLGNATLLEHINGHGGRATSGKHGIKQENVTVINVSGELIIKELGLSSLLITLDQDLANAHGAAAFTQALLHGFTSTHDGDTTDLTLELDTREGCTGGGLDGRRLDGELVKTLLDKQTDDTVSVKDKVRALGVAITDDSVEALELVGLGKHDDVGHDGLVIMN